MLLSNEHLLPLVAKFYDSNATQLDIQNNGIKIIAKIHGTQHENKKEIKLNDLLLNDFCISKNQQLVRH